MKSIISIFFLVLISLNSIAQTDINKLDDKGNKHGKWIGVYPDSKRPRYEGVFNHGKEIGIFKYLDDTKAITVIATRTFKENTTEAYTVFYDQNGFIVSQGNTVNKLKEGEWTFYHYSSKDIMSTEVYLNDKLNGLKKVFYKSGGLAEEVQYVKDFQNGIYKKYAENDVVLEESNYLNGEYHGKINISDASNISTIQGQYKNGRAVGVWKYFTNNKLEKEENKDELNNKKAKPLSENKTNKKKKS